MTCGREQTRNPHPHAGEPGHSEASYEWICVPCLVENRHRWAGRAMRAEALIRKWEAHLLAAGALADIDALTAASRVVRRPNP